jgi:hypothetical protein
LLASQWSEPTRADGGVCIPEIVTIEIDVLPSEWSDVDEQRIWRGLAMATHGTHGRAILRSIGTDGRTTSGRMHNGVWIARALRHVPETRERFNT